jgi:hypothetical protein
MSLEEANYIVRFSINYSPLGWYFVVDTMRPFGKIIGYNKFETANEAVEELKQFLRYFTENVLKDGEVYENMLRNINQRKMTIKIPYYEDLSSKKELKSCNQNLI